VSTAGSRAEIGDQGICKLYASVLQRHYGGENFLLILHHQNVDLENAFATLESKASMRLTRSDA